MINNKYITHLSIKILKNICKLNNIKFNNKKLIKRQLITKINKYLLEKLTKIDLIDIAIQYNFSINHNKNKQYIISQILYYIKKNKKFNIVSIYYNNLTNKLTNKLTNNSTNKLTNNSTNNSTNKLTNESFGITCEYTLCKLFNLKCDLFNRVDLNILPNMLLECYKIKKELLSKNLKIYQFKGYKNTKVDFILLNLKNNNTYTLSVKSNTSSNCLVCPQNIGQCTIKSFINFIGNIPKFNNIKLKSIYSIKKFIIKNINILLPLYINNLYCCDYLLWIINKKNTIDYKLLKKKNLKFNHKISFTKTIKKWNESNTVKYNNVSIGVFQIHKNRNCIKFRFYLKNLLKLK